MAPRTSTTAAPMAESEELMVSALAATDAMGAALARLPGNRGRIGPTASDVLNSVARRPPER